MSYVTRLPSFAKTAHVEADIPISQPDEFERTIVDSTPGEHPRTDALDRDLAGLSNAQDYAFDLTKLRGLDTKLANACLDYLNYDRLSARSWRPLDPDGINVKSKSDAHKWLFPTRIRPKAFSWKSSRLAVQRINWGELCVTKELASAWADRLLEITRLALSPDKSLRGHYHGTTACLDALLHAERFPEPYDVLHSETFWSYKRSIPRTQLLSDLIEGSPGDEGNWFATAKELGMYDVALKLVHDSPCDPKTLARAARDFAEREPAFAHGAGFAALHWLSRGHGYELTSIDVWGAHHSTLKAAERLGTLSDTKTRIRQLVAQEAAGGFVRQILGRELELV
jgi:hypothetical protein